MKIHQHLLPLRSLGVFACLLALSCGLGRAQAPVAERLDVFFGDTKLLPIDGPIDSYTVAPDGIVKVDKATSSPNELSIVGLAGGSAALTVKSGGRTLLYDVAVSPAPVRLYINLNESQRLTFPNPIDDTSVSQQGVVHVVQPDTSNNVLLVEALLAGKTTLTVYSKGEIYRYFISTFENRGADVLEIQNAFSAKGYRNLTITFDKDQAVIGGTVPTQEELDDAVRIVKQFTDYVVVKATLGEEVLQSEFTEEEQIIINNIQRIANVKGLTIRVKFPLPTKITSTTYTTSTGDYVEPTTTTTPQGGTIRGAGFLPPNPNQQQQGPNAEGPTELPPQKNVTETVTESENTSVPEKVFLYGDLQDDLEEAKVLRVARTFCPFIVSFLTVKDPIQIRTQIQFLQIKDTDVKDTGVLWSGTGAGGGPAIILGFGSTTLNLFGSVPAPVVGFMNSLTYGVEGAVSATATLSLFETLDDAKIIREAEIFLTNGQPGWYSEGEVESYIASSITTASSPPVTSLTASAVFLGVNMDIAPLNLAGGVTEPQGQKIFGIPSSIGGGSSNGYTLIQDSDPTAQKIGNLNAPIQASGTVPVIDNTVKYVDENGLIGMDVSTQLTLPNGGFTPESIAGTTISLPDFFVRTTRTRVNLRDGQPVAINGLIDKEITRDISQIPYLAKIPLFGYLFRSHADEDQNEEVIVLVTPHIVRMRDPNSSRTPKPALPELEDFAREEGYVPVIKPVRYDANAVDIRPETPKDMKESANANTPPANDSLPLAPHASGGLQTLQPAPESAPAPKPVVDKASAATDVSRQPSSARLAPSSTLP